MVSSKPFLELGIELS